VYESILSIKPYNLSKEQITWVNQTLVSLSDDEKLGQLICEIIWDKPGCDPLDVMKHFLPGAVMYRPFKAKRMREFTQRLQKASKIPLLIACNLERGGSGGNGGMEDGTYVASPMGVAATDDESSAEHLGEVCASEGSAVGVNWTYEPIIDIDMNPENPITNVRTYGSDPERIIRMAKAYCRGCRKWGVLTTIKHFPGDGVDYRDQHLMSSVNNLSADEWMDTYGRIYQALIEDGAETLMSAHIRQPNVTRMVNPLIKDEEIMPGSLSKELMQGILRGRFHFNGLICTDATQMVGYTCSMPRHEALPTSIQNGADMLTFTLNPTEDFKALQEGLSCGLLTHERLDEAVARILGMKAKLRLPERKDVVPPLHAMERIQSKKHKKWALEIADESITLVKDKQKGLLPLSPQKTKRIILVQATNEKPEGGYLSEARLFKELLEKEGFIVHWFEEVPRPGTGYSIEDLKRDTDLFIYYANFKVSSNQTTIRLVWSDFLGDSSPKFVCDVPTLFLSFSNPYHLVDVPMVKTYINAYTSNEATVRMMIEKLMGRSSFKGKSPVDPFAGLWDARL
jgi:beta-N-acetylhexosaminidase